MGLRFGLLPLRGSQNCAAVLVGASRQTSLSIVAATHEAAPNHITGPPARWVSHGFGLPAQWVSHGFAPWFSMVLETRHSARSEAESQNLHPVALSFVRTHSQPAGDSATPLRFAQNDGEADTVGRDTVGHPPRSPVMVARYGTPMLQGPVWVSHGWAVWVSHGWAKPGVLTWGILVVCLDFACRFARRRFLT